jgi:hypothetical protein
MLFRVGRQWKSGESSSVSDNLIEEATYQGVSHMERIQNVEDAMWDSNQEGLSLLKEDVFAELSDQEKVDALQFLIDMEMTYLGCESVQLIVYDLDDPDRYGFYNDNRRIIALNEYLLSDSVRKCMETCLHESWHAYQYACIQNMMEAQVNTDLYMYKDVMEWKENLENYVNVDAYSTDEEKLQYRYQKVEASANAYVEAWLDPYCAYIESIER